MEWPSEEHIEVLKPCPFCGDQPYFDACDRVISIGCKRCGFHRAFHGLVQSEINTGIPIHYDTGEVSDHEWYDQFAHERAIAAWNRRAEVEELIKRLEATQADLDGIYKTLSQVEVGRYG